MPRPAIDKQRLEQFCRRHHIRELSLFGSTLEGTAAPDSDAGLPAKCETGREPDLNVLVSWGHEPSAVLSIREVARRTAHDLAGASTRETAAAEAQRARGGS
ncbi:MAG: nucleotidyltransferase [Proteobacteria bacterium]|nr:nucleotidyltransferase [Pseudomonadota bacterium]